MAKVTLRRVHGKTVPVLIVRKQESGLYNMSRARVVVRIGSDELEMHVYRNGVKGNTAAFIPYDNYKSLLMPYAGQTATIKDATPINEPPIHTQQNNISTDIEVLRNKIIKLTMELENCRKQVSMLMSAIERL
jgi:hypothetical protein